MNPQVVFFLVGGDTVRVLNYSANVDLRRGCLRDA
jgi:hypothetical protein